MFIPKNICKSSHYVFSLNIKFATSEVAKKNPKQ